MVNSQLSWLHSLSIFLLVLCETLNAQIHDISTLKSAIYLSPELVMQPGSVSNKFYYNIDFPRGPIGIKSFNAEVVDEFGVPVSLQDTYLHHWYFGLGSETRKTATYVPDPYAIEVGNPSEIPKGYEERWLVNIHAIDSRGAEDKLGCTECKCSLYNVTIVEYGRPISADYEGGLPCCYDETRCKVKEGFELSPRKLYLRYTIKWFDWNKSLLPVDIYIFDITDTWKASMESMIVM